MSGKALAAGSLRDVSGKALAAGSLRDVSGKALAAGSLRCEQQGASRRLIFLFHSIFYPISIMNQKFFVAAITALAVCLTLATQLQAQEKPERGINGQEAPSWSVSQWHQLPSGKDSIDIDDYSGKVTYLYFFQSWCPGCHKQGFPTLQELTKKYKDDPEVAFVAIQTTFEGYKINTADKLKEMATRYDLTIPFGQSKGIKGTPEIMRKYRTGGTPWVVIIDKQGVVRFNDFHISPANGAAGIEKLKAQAQPTVQTN